MFPSWNVAGSSPVSRSITHSMRLRESIPTVVAGMRLRLRVRASCGLNA